MDNKISTQNGGGLKIARTKKIITSIPLSIPHEKIKLEKLADGYRLSACHTATEKDERGSYESSFKYETEEHYGVHVDDLKGEFNKDGFYEVSIFFKE